MIDVKLLARTNVDPVKLASHAALMCYQDTPPDFGKEIDVKNRLFDVGHHTTLQHFFMTYQIDGISVGDVTFGLHLASPFYNSDQRSGRFCAKMFLNPDFGKIGDYIKFFWPNIRHEKIDKIVGYIKSGLEVYFTNIEGATNLAKQFIKEERPFASEKYIEANAPKFAQEQMRMFIPVIFPTGLDFTINLSSLVALYESAWNPVMKHITTKMAMIMLTSFPKLHFMFNKERRREKDCPSLFRKSGTGQEINYEPILWGFDVWGDNFFKKPESNIMHPIDLLHYQPELMGNNFAEIRSGVEISLATMGQDQRHRTISRSEPYFTGRFYLPPLLKEMGLEKEAASLLKRWCELTEEIPPALARIIAPYGAMVRYSKRGSLNAIVHEQMKRLCWCAQEEIYHLSRMLRRNIENENLLSVFAPACYKTGSCAEGNRYCGRDIRVRETGDYFPARKV